MSGAEACMQHVRTASHVGICSTSVTDAHEGTLRSLMLQLQSRCATPLRPTKQEEVEKGLPHMSILPPQRTHRVQLCANICGRPAACRSGTADLQQLPTLSVCVVLCSAEASSMSPRLCPPSILGADVLARRLRIVSARACHCFQEHNPRRSLARTRNH